MPMRGDGVAVALDRGDDLAERVVHRRPDLVGVVLDPARAGEVLRELAVGEGAAHAVGVHRDRAHAGRAGVDREDDLGHVSSAQGVGERATGGAASRAELEHVRARRGVGREHLQQQAVAHAGELEVVGGCVEQHVAAVGEVTTTRPSVTAT